MTVPVLGRHPVPEHERALGVGPALHRVELLEPGRHAAEGQRHVGGGCGRAGPVRVDVGEGVQVAAPRSPRASPRAPPSATAHPPGRHRRASRHPRSRACRSCSDGSTSQRRTFLAEDPGVGLRRRRTMEGMVSNDAGDPGPAPGPGRPLRPGAARRVRVPRVALRVGVGGRGPDLGDVPRRRRRRPTGRGPRPHRGLADRRRPPQARRPLATEGARRAGHAAEPDAPAQLDDWDVQLDAAPRPRDAGDPRRPPPQRARPCATSTVSRSARSPPASAAPRAPPRSCSSGPRPRSASSYENAPTAAERRSDDRPLRRPPPARPSPRRPDRASPGPCAPGCSTRSTSTPPTVAAPIDLPRRKSMSTTTTTPTATAVIPYLTASDAVGALAWYAQAFGAEEQFRVVGPDGLLGHAEFRIGDAVFYLSDEHPAMGVVSPTTLGGHPVRHAPHRHRRGPDVRPGRRRRRHRPDGARADQPHGARHGTLLDPYGHRWMLSQPHRGRVPRRVRRPVRGRALPGRGGQRCRAGTARATSTASGPSVTYARRRSPASASSPRCSASRSWSWSARTRTERSRHSEYRWPEGGIVQIAELGPRTNPFLPRAGRAGAVRGDRRPARRVGALPRPPGSR